MPASPLCAYQPSQSHQEALFAPCTQDAHVFAVDLSPVAVAYAAANARTTGLSDHVTVLNGSWFEPVATAVEASQQLATSATGAVEVQQPEQGDEPGSAAPGAAEVQQSVQGDEPESAATDAQAGGHSNGLANFSDTMKAG
eukprot:scaffold46826_cov19-Tisochrysis_lutea.AAC.1